MEFAADWVTEGWSKVDGIWVELGQSASVTSVTAIGLDENGNVLYVVPATQEHRNRDSFPAILTIHQVADKLNELERKCQTS